MAITHPDRTVVVVRHAKAEKQAESDHARRLTDRGRGDAAAAGSAVASALSPTPGTASAGRSVALVSSATRAHESWKQLAPALTEGSVVEEQVTDDLFEAGVDDVLGLLGRLDDDVAAVVVVGHNPTMEAAVEALVGSAEPDVRTRLDERGFPTAAVAVLSYAGSWVDLGPSGCRLIGFEVGRAGSP